MTVKDLYVTLIPHFSMNIDLHFFLLNGVRWARTTPDDGLLGASLREIIADIDACKRHLKKLNKLSNRDVLFEHSNMISIKIDKSEVEINAIWEPSIMASPKVSLSYEEYERIVRLWKKFLEDLEEVKISIEINDSSVLADEAEKYGRKNMAKNLLLINREHLLSWHDQYCLSYILIRHDIGFTFF